MQTCPPNMVSIYVVGKLTQIYFCKGTPWQYFSTCRGEKYCHIWRRIRIILRCVLLIGHLWREIAKWAFLWGAGGQNSLSELWTNTSLSPNLVIHSPVASLSLLPNVAKQVFSFLELVFYQQRWMKTDKKIWYFSWGKGGVEPNEKRVISWKSNLANSCKKNPLTFFASLRSFLFIQLHYLKYTIFNYNFSKFSRWFWMSI